MDQLWRELKRLIAAHRQAISANALASDAADWVLGLTPPQARRKAGMAWQHYWLRNLVRDFWPPTYRAGLGALGRVRRSCLQRQHPAQRSVQDGPSQLYRNP